MLFSSLTLLLLSASAIAHGPTRPQKHQHVRKRYEIDDRGLPITATTVVTVRQTLTETIWVEPTGQVVFQPTSVVVSASASASASAVVSSASELPTESNSASASESASTEEPSASASQSVVASSTESATPSSSAGPESTSISESAIPSESASSPVSASASPSVTESVLPSVSSEAVSESASRSASRTNRPSGSASVSSATESASTGPLSSSASATPSDSSSTLPSQSSEVISESASRSASRTNRPSGSASVSSATESPSTEPSSSSASATPSDSSSTLPSQSSEAISESASRSASRTNRPSGSASASSATESASAEPTSLISSASGLASASSSVSRSASRSNRNSATASPSPSSSTSSTESSSSVEASSTSSSSAAAPSETHVAGTVRSGLLMNGYYPDWSSWKLAPENVDWSKFDVVDFAFAIPTAEFGLVFTQDNSADLLKRLVASAHAAGKLVKLSIGGWTGSVHFSDACRTSENRQTFIGHIIDAYDAYKLDGIDLDWEYPGGGGAGNNGVAGADSANFLLFLQELRDALPHGALITAATQVYPFADDKGDPMTDVSAFAKVLDWILIMNYDIWGSAINGEQPGPNAPLGVCDPKTSGQPLANAEASILSWTRAGFPANQITLGVPAYGYLSKSSAWSLRQRRSSKPQRRADVTILNDNGGPADGQIQFWNLISQGALVRDDSGHYIGAGGFTRSWDECSKTPWLRSGSSGQIITYDDPDSLSIKGQFAAQAGLRGCNVFSMDGDTASWELVSAVRSGMGI